MAKEYRITTKDILGTGEDDCYIDPSDPVFGMTDNLLYKHRPVQPTEPVEETWEQKYIRENNIKPGSPAWHALRQTK